MATRDERRQGKSKPDPHVPYEAHVGVSAPFIQKRYLAAIQRVAPEVLEDLRDSVGPVWERADADHLGDPRALEEWARLAYCFSDPALEDLRDSLLAWAERFRLSAGTQAQGYSDTPARTETYTGPDVEELLRERLKIEAEARSLFPADKRSRQRLLSARLTGPLALVTEESGKAVIRSGIHRTVKVGSQCTWVLNAALKTLDRWSRHPRFSNPPRWLESTAIVFSAPEAPTLELKWEYTLVGRSAFRRQAIQKLERYLDEVEAKVRTPADMGGHGLTQVSRPRKDEHFEWLVMYQVQGLTYDQIVARTEKSLGTVSEAVEGAARSLGIGLRAARRRGPNAVRR